MKSHIMSYIVLFTFALVTSYANSENINQEAKEPNSTSFLVSKRSRSEWEKEKNEAIRSLAKKYPLTDGTDQTSWTRSESATNNVTIKVCVGQVKYKEYGPFLYRTMTFDSTGKLISISEVNEACTFRCNDVIQIQ